MIRWSMLGLLIAVGSGTMLPTAAHAQDPPAGASIEALVTQIVAEMASIDARLALAREAAAVADASTTSASVVVHLRGLAWVDLFGRGMSVGSRGTTNPDHVLEPIRVAFKPSFGHRGASVRATIPFW